MSTDQDNKTPANETSDTQKVSHPPIAKRQEHSETHHDVRLDDPYHWLRDPDYPTVETPEILKYLEAENAWFEAGMAPLRPLVNTLFEEIKGRIKDDDASVPVKYGPYQYWRRFEKGAEYRTWLRQPVDAAGNETGAEEVILDEPTLADGLDYFSVRTVEPDPAHRCLVWSSDDDGSERYTLHLKVLEDGTAIDSPIPNTSGAAVWSQDGAYLLYVELSEQLRPFRVKAHRLGTPIAEDVTLFEEDDTSFFVHIGETLSRKYLLISSGDHITSEVRLLPARDPLAAPQLVAPRQDGHEYGVVDGGDALYIRTNLDAKNFRLVRAPYDAPEPANWVDMVPADPAIYLRGAQAFKSFIVLQERVEGIDRIRILFHSGGTVTTDHVVAFEETVYSAGLGECAEFDTLKIRLHYTSMITPATVYDFDLDAEALIERKVQEIPSGYDKSKYQTERISITARDGVTVPISLVRRIDAEAKGPLHLYAYGAYGMGMTPAFSPGRLSLLDRGFTFAIAHIRGGDELGYGWYESGKLMERRNTFNDFIDCARALCAMGHAEEGGISISGGSAGGTLMGVVLNEAPALWKAAVAHVPFVDVLNTMLDETLPLTPIEWPEWGDPITDKAAFDYIHGYSPYENVTAQAYPPILITAGLSDPRVTYWEPAKWAARLRSTKTDGNDLYLKTNMGAGHGGKSGRYQAIEETAEEYAFVLNAFGLA